jgi:hypothetical protein
MTVTQNPFSKTFGLEVLEGPESIVIIVEDKGDAVSLAVYEDDGGVFCGPRAVVCMPKDRARLLITLLQKAVDGERLSV